MTKAEMSRADVEAMIQAVDGKPIDLHDKALSGLDLSALNLRGATMRTARLNKATDLTDVVLMGSDLSGANPTGATVAGADFKNVDISGARLIDLRGQSEAEDWAERVNVDRAITQAIN